VFFAPVPAIRRLVPKPLSARLSPHLCWLFVVGAIFFPKRCGCLVQERWGPFLVGSLVWGIGAFPRRHDRVRHQSRTPIWGPAAWLMPFFADRWKGAAPTGVMRPIPVIGPLLGGVLGRLVCCGYGASPGLLPDSESPCGFVASALVGRDSLTSAATGAVLPASLKTQ